MGNYSQSSTMTVLITGAAGGIGRATVNLFATSGWRVIGVDRSTFGDDFPQDGFFIQSDISVGGNLKSIFDQAHAHTGYLNALVNNAAVQIAKPIIQTSVEEWDAVMASNLRSVFLVPSSPFHYLPLQVVGLLSTFPPSMRWLLQPTLLPMPPVKGGYYHSYAGHGNRICSQ